MHQTLISTSNELINIPAFAPPWAHGFGEDTYGIFAEFWLNEVHFVWRWIPPGRFMMGSPTSEQGRWDDEGPQHEVIITRGYWLGETPVTQQQWVALVGKNPSRFQEPTHPVEQVSWNDCQQFVSVLNDGIPSLGSALPTEAQWEYACRAGTQGAFHIEKSQCMQPEGKDPTLHKLGWYSENSEGKTHPVKQKDPNNWGLYDMHGNVGEWCQDRMRKYSTAIESNPIGLSEVSNGRMVRGGTWVSRAHFCRAAFRALHPSSDDRDYVGLRLSAGQAQGTKEVAPITAEHDEKIA